jgi:hypothetical protein
VELASRVTRNGVRRALPPAIAILLSVHADDQEWASTGKQILELTGAEDISSTGQTRGDYDNSDRATARGKRVVPVQFNQAPLEEACRGRV